MKPPKLTAEELSRVLSAHDAGGLITAGAYGYTGLPACLMQAAKVDEHAMPANPMVKWFDRNYQREWTVDEFLGELEWNGIA